MAAVNITFPGNLAQVETANDLRSIPTSLIPEGSLYLVIALEGIFIFEPGSLAVDDAATVIRPSDRTPLQAGRWLKSAKGFAQGRVGDPGGNVLSISSKIAANGTNVGAGTSLTQTADYADNGQGQSLYSANVPNAATILANHPRAAYTAADGRVFARVKGIPSISDFGAVGDNSTDDYPAIWAAFNWCTDVGEPVMTVPSGQGYLSQTLNIDKAIIIRGMGAGKANPGQRRSAFRMAPNTTAIDVHTPLTSPRTGQAGIIGGDNSVIDGLYLIGDINDTTSKAVRMRARTALINTGALYFAYGAYVVASATATDDAKGNANDWLIQSCRFEAQSRDAMLFGGQDANGGLALNVDISGANGWAVNHQSFLSNTFLAIQTTSCGTFTYRRSGTFAGVNHKSALTGDVFWFFVPKQGATTAGLAATAPGTDANIWTLVYKFSNPAYPVWASGTMTYAPGGPFASLSNSSPATFTGCYSESDMGPSQINYPAQIYGGTHAAGIIGTGAPITNRFGNVSTPRGYEAYDADTGRNAILGDDAWITWAHPMMFPQGIKWQQRGTDMILGYGNSDINEIMRIYGPTSATPQAFSPKTLILPGAAFADDAAAAAAGVPVTGAYKKTGGSIAWRVS